MCGIAGVVDPTGAGPTPQLLRRMTATLRHRGPDDEATWCAGPAGLGMARLAVIDLSPRARQPMTNEDGSLWLVFNGEIYNFLELRAGLRARGHRFRSEGDAEAILHLYEEGGVDAVHELRGMFAFGLWDVPRRRLLLARDRLGKKPLFHTDAGGVFLFASEPKAMLQHPALRAEVDPEAVHHFLTYGYVPAPRSAFRGVQKLPPGHVLVLEGGRARVERYWTLRYTPKRTEPEAALAEELTARLDEAVRLRLVSDVPAGALLSGGVDSSAVVAVARRFSSGRLQTFSIGFDDAEFDERSYAREVARHLGTDHHELVVKIDALALLPRLVWHYGEPFADASAVPTFALCEMARRFVTVALSGDGGDEAFLGYDRYRATVLAASPDRLPAGVRSAIARGARHLRGSSTKSLGYRLRRFAEALALSPRARYARWTSVFDAQAKLALYTGDFAMRVGALDSFAVLEAAYDRSDAPSFVEATADADVQLYLPDDLLVKMDIASMAHSLEVRSPLLDHRLVEFAARLPPSLKLRGATQKYLLKRAMRDALPASVLRRNKMGFGAPIERWFRGELGDLAGDLLLDARARGRGYFRPDVVRRYLDEHRAGRAQHHQRLWSLLMLEMWHRTFIDQPCPTEAPASCG